MKLTRIGVGATLTVGVLLFAAAAPAYAANEAGESEAFASSVAEADGAESTAAASTTTESDAIEPRALDDSPVFTDPTPTDDSTASASAGDDASEEPSAVAPETPDATDDEPERPAQPAPIVSTTDWRDVAPNCESGVYTQIRDYTETPYVWDDVNGVWAAGSASETTTQTGTRPMSEAELQSCPGYVPEPEPTEEPAPTEEPGGDPTEAPSEEPTGPDTQPAPPASDSGPVNPAPSSPVQSSPAADDDDTALPTIGNSAPVPVDDDAAHEDLSATGANTSSAGLLGVFLTAAGAGLLAVRRVRSVDVA